MLNITSLHLSVGQESIVRTKSINLNNRRSSLQSIVSEIQPIEGNKIKLPSLCNAVSCSKTIINKQVKRLMKNKFLLTEDVNII